MTSLIQQIEEMRVRMNELAAGEQDLVRALGDALTSADQKLLQDVRSVAAEHEARRSAILNELQSLSARMGALPRPRGPFASPDGGAKGFAVARLAAAGAGCWRLAPGGRQYRGRGQLPFVQSRVGELTASFDLPSHPANPCSFKR